MKLVFCISLSLLAPGVRAQKKDFILEGRIGRLNSPAQMYMVHETDGKVAIDSVPLKDGAFRFRGAMDGPGKVILYLEHDGQRPARGQPADGKIVYLDGGTVALRAADSVSRAVVTGSPLSTAVDNYHALFTGLKDQLLKLTQQAKATTGQKPDPATVAAFKARYALLVKQKEAIDRKYVQEHPASYVSLIALQSLIADKAGYASIRPLFDGLTPGLRNSPDGRKIADKLEAMN